MTEYEDKNGIVNDNEIKHFLKDYDYETTDNTDDALWVLRDGTMISNGASENYGQRSEDHIMIDGLISEDKFNPEFYNQIQAKTSMLRIVPETEQILIAKGQHLTEKQNEFKKKSGYFVSAYADDVDPNKPEQKYEIKQAVSQLDNGAELEV